MAVRKTAAGKTKQKFVYSETEERSMDIDYVPPPERPAGVSNLLRYSCWGLLIFTGVSDLLAGGYKPDEIGIAAFRFVLMAAFAALFSWLCAGMAKKAGKNLDFAWAMGFLFGFIGFMVYWGYHRFTIMREAKSAEKGKAGKDKGERNRKKPVR